tara:strand:- start:439 stop:576 length:138 start_codon:yes stop_codon:yes gene_type:complete
MRIYVLHTSMVFIWSISLEFLARSNQLFFSDFFEGSTIFISLSQI